MDLPQLLLVTHNDMVVKLLLCTSILIYSFFEQYRFYRSVTKDNTGGEEAVDNGEEDLDCDRLALVLTTST